MLSPVILIPAVLNGLLTGAVYALVALGLTLIYGVLHIINFAHGALLSAALFAAFFAFKLLGLDPYLAVFLLAPVFFALGYALQRFVIGPASQGDDRNMLLVTLGASIVIENALLYAFRADTRTIDVPYAFETLDLGFTFLPIPRVIVLKLAPGPVPDLEGLRKLLSERVANASLDDHRGFVDRMRAMANSAVAAGVAILILMLAATVLSVTFATRGAMAANRPIIEVLHLIGAKDGFIAGEFQRHFLLLGIKGGAIGGGAAMVLFAVAGFAGSSVVGTVAGDQFTSLFGAFTIGWEGYATLVAQIVLIAIVTAAASRHTVNQTLESV